MNIAKLIPKTTAVRHQSFFPLLIVVFGIWCLYRFLFAFPVWFDETIGKLIFFGLPVWLYAVLAQTKITHNTVDSKKFLPGLYLGLAFGGIYSFVGILAILAGRSDLTTVALFLSPAFWIEFFLALMTGFWESLFFFGWIFLILEKYFTGNITLTRLVLLNSFIFLLFHIPNTLLRFPFLQVIPQLFLLFLFAVGQGLIFYRYRNIYSLTLSHALWGMTLLIHGSSF